MKLHKTKKALLKMVFILFSGSTLSSEICTQKQHRIQLPESFHEGHYVRLSSDGRYLIVTRNMPGQGPVGVLEVSYSQDTYSLRSFESPLMDEAYPVEPHWELISSPYHEDGSMKYFRLADILRQEQKAEPVYSSFFNEFYNSIGGDSSRFTMKRWNWLGARDYRLENGRIVDESETYLMCPNLLNLSEENRKKLDLVNSEEVIRMLAFIQTNIRHWMQEFYSKCAEKRGEEVCQSEEVSEEFLQFVRMKWNAEFNQFIEVLKSEPGANSTLIQESAGFIEERFFQQFDASSVDKKNGNANQIEEYILDQPILSPDAKMIAGIFEQTMRVYKIDSQTKYCHQIYDFGARTSKVSFGYPDSVSQNWVTFNVFPEPGTVIGDSAEAAPVFFLIVADIINGNRVGFPSNSPFGSYPNLTADGRLFHLESTELVITDVYQQSGGQLGQSCVTLQDLEAIYPQ